jgi:glycosyltransferase 2 family protein
VFVKIALFVDNLSVGFDILKSPGYLLLTLVQSFVLWWLLGLSVWVLAFGCPGIEHITFLQAFAVEIIICFAIMLPSVPGYWGLWEAGGVFGLSLFGIPANEAAGMVLTYHFFHLIPVILIGLVSAMIIGVNITQATQTGEEALHQEEEHEIENLERRSGH